MVNGKKLTLGRSEFGDYYSTNKANKIIKKITSLNGTKNDW